MSRGVAFEVQGVPAPQGSKRAIVHRHTGRAVVIESAGERLKVWREAVTLSAKASRNGQGPLEGPVAVTVFFYLPKPQRPRHVLPITRPDVDKLARAILDALTVAGVFTDDSQVVTLTVRKRYGVAPRAHVIVHEES